MNHLQAQAKNLRAIAGLLDEYHPAALYFLITDYEEGGMDCFGPWDTPEEAKAEQLEPMTLHKGDRWLIVAPVEIGQVEE